MAVVIRRRTRLPGGWAFLLASLLPWPGAVMAGQGGELDPAFGDGGRVLLGEKAGARAVLQLPDDGKLVVAGYKVTDAGDADFLVMRLTTDGTIDTTFGQDGIVTIDFDGGGDSVSALALQDDGKIIAAGTSAGAFNITGLAMVRLNADGSLDPGYGVDGRVRRQLLGEWESLADIELDDTGGVVVALESGEMIFARFDAAGILDPTFGTGELPGTTAINVGYYLVSGLLRQPDGKLVACGASINGELTYDGYMSAVRLNPDGSLDTTFATGGTWRGGEEFFFTGANDCGLMADGSIVLAGFGGEVGETYVLSALLESNGVLASERWYRGTSAIEFAAVEYAESLAVLDDGYVALTGVAKTHDEEGFVSPGDMFVALIEPESGLADPGFGSQGVTVVDFDDLLWNDISGGEAIFQQADGKLVVGGYVVVDEGLGLSYSPHPAVVRMNRGEIDPAGFLGTYERNIVVEESVGEIVITAMRAGGDSGAVTLDYETINGTASAPGDYIYASGTLAWGDADMEPKIITIAVVNDQIDEAAETFTVSFSNSTLMLANTGVRVTIAKSDTAPATPRPPVPPPTRASSGGGAMDLGGLLLLLAGFLVRHVRCGWSRAGGRSYGGFLRGPHPG